MFHRHHICSMHPSTHTSKHMGWHCTPGTTAEASLRVKSCIAVPSTDSMPIQPTQVYRKGDQISAISNSLWALNLSIPLGNSALLFCVSSYHNADSVPLLICNMFYFSCKKKKKKKCFAFYPVRVPVLLLAFTFSLYCTVTPFCKMVLIADWAPVFWLLCTLITCFFICSTAGAKTWCPCIPQTLASWRQIGSV